MGVAGISRRLLLDWRSSQPLHKFPIPFEELVFGQFLGPLPDDALEFGIHRLAAELRHAIEQEPDGRAVAVSDVIMRHLSADPGFDGELFAEFARQGVAGIFAGLDLAARELPLQCMAAASALANQDAAVPFEDSGNYIHSGIIGTRMHSERLLDHFRHPRNAGELPPPAVRVDVENPACGDILRLSARFEDGRVAEACFRTRGCTASIAAASALTEWMKGKSRAELGILTTSVIEEALGGLEPASKHAAVLCVDGVKQLLAAMK